MDLSVVIPAFNEADYLPRYLPTVRAAVCRWENRSRSRGEIIVVDNASSDATAHVARSLGARVIHEPRRNIAHARNTGAAAASAPMLFFVDADVALPLEAVDVVTTHLRSGSCVGGAIPPSYAPRRLGARLLCGYWDWYRRRRGGAQGVAQFCTADAFHALRGYRTDLYMSEDVEFFRRLREYGEDCRRPVLIVNELRVWPSTRRYDQWPTWRMVFWQNPITARAFLTSARFWRHWYDDTTVR
ncbi:MAG TPA: glycosyltransferase [Actinophytocola sp.]|jgi:glycosyltransferase involved in cell wall biosynthesis|uniref:glycosyltransferase n=1 Tax=Actinophytocola sp. TaxID=1872138 RepID=UPI002E0A6CFD|nr:glycosyltransferase [Actinophytocola sp.]